jgi:hypothetical protein
MEETPNLLFLSVNKYSRGNSPVFFVGCKRFHHLRDNFEKSILDFLHSKSRPPCTKFNVVAFGLVRRNRR